MSYCHEVGEEHDFESTITLSRMAGTPHHRCTKCRCIQLPDDDDEAFDGDDDPENDDEGDDDDT